MTEETLKQYFAKERSKTGFTAPNGTAESPFKVPEGYFDTLCDSIMNNLSTTETKSKPRILVLRKRFWQHAAATLIAVSTIGMALYESVKNDEQITSDKSYFTEEIIQSYEDDNYVNDALDYAMIGNDEIAEYLTGN